MLIKKIIKFLIALSNSRNKPMRNKKNILIIGGTGFLGYHLIKLCISRYNVSSISLTRPVGDKRIKKVKYIECDISNKKSIEKKIKDNFDIVVNLGGYINHKNQNSALKTHYKGCKNLVKYFKNKKIKIFIQIGSSSEYGKKSPPHIEDLKGKPSTIYGKSKLLASKFLLNYSKKNKIPFTILRFYQVYGPNQNKDRMISIVINSSLKNKRFNCSSGIQKRDFLYVSDAVNAIYKCFNNKKILGKIINIGSGKSINIKKMILLLNKKIKKGKPIFGVIKLRPDEPLNSYPNLINAKKYLGWRAKTDLKLGIKKTINFYKKQLGT